MACDDPISSRDLRKPSRSAVSALFIVSTSKCKPSLRAHLPVGSAIIPHPRRQAPVDFLLMWRAGPAWQARHLGGTYSPRCSVLSAALSSRMMSATARLASVLGAAS